MKGVLVVIWLDLSNAYGPMPHKLVQLTLQRYHVPGKIQKLSRSYFNRLQLRFSGFHNIMTASVRSNCHKLYSFSNFVLGGYGHDNEVGEKD